MANIVQGNETKFNEVADVYDKMRPGYVEELYKDIFNYANLNPQSKILEIGVGTGQATRPFLEKGCDLTAVEIGNNLASYTAKKYEKYKNLMVKNEAFQEFDSSDNTFDLIYSASAFHWIPEELGYTKVYNLLKPGGVFVRFANHPYKDKSQEEMDTEIQKVYSVYMPQSKPSPEFTEEFARERAKIAEKYGFTDIAYKLYKRTRTFTSEQYAELLGTYSDHLALEDNVRNEFFSKVKQVIDEFGGTITLCDTIDLEMGKKC